MKFTEQELADMDASTEKWNNPNANDSLWERPTGEDILANIQKHIARGGKVMVCTYTQAKIYKNAAMFKVGKDGHIYVQRGKHWDDIAYCSINYI